MADSQLVINPMLADVAIFGIVGLAQMCVLSIGDMNLAVGRMAAVGAMAAGFGYDKLQLTLWSGLLVGLVAGALLGFIAGWIIARTGVSAFVVTLAMDFALLGFVALIYTKFGDAAAFTTQPPGMNELASYSLADLCLGNICGTPAVPQLALFAVLAAIVVAILFHRTRPGRELLMLGDSRRAAEMSGLANRRLTILAHTVSGLLAALAGWLLGINNGSFTAAIGGDFMLPSFLGPVLGGTLLTGGVISVVGTLLGTLLTQVIRRGLSLLEVSLSDLNIYIGVVLLLALSSERVRSQLAGSLGRARHGRRPPDESAPTAQEKTP